MSRAYWTRAMVLGTRDERTQAILPSPRARLELVRHYSMGMPADQPQPAECSTEIGADADDADPQLSAAVWRLYGAVLLVSVCALIVVVLA
jgi:hypothetical protein